MPLRDHFRPPLDNLTSWEGFHAQWPAMIVQALARKLVQSVRDKRTRSSGVDALMHEFSLSSEEGVALMCLAEASVILEEVNRCGGNAGTAHAQMYTMGTILRHGSAQQKRLPSW